jgi:hypothetical protein
MKGNVINVSHGLLALAFADLILLSDEEKAQSLLNHTESYLNALGMRIAAEKCASFKVMPTKDSWYITNPHISVSNGNKIPNSAADSSVSYLRSNISMVWTALQKPRGPAGVHN